MSERRKAIEGLCEVWSDGAEVEALARLHVYRDDNRPERTAAISPGPHPPC